MKSYPKYCCKGHPEITYNVKGGVDQCPLCIALEKIQVLKQEVEELTTEVEDLRNYKHDL